MKLLTQLVVCLSLAACASSTAQPTKTASDTSASAARPDSAKSAKHFRDHVKYPASRAEILAACADTPEFSGGEKKWLADNLPEKSYASADEVIGALHL